MAAGHGQRRFLPVRQLFLRSFAGFCFAVGSTYHLLREKIFTCMLTKTDFCFYRAMHCSAKHGLEITCRLSVRLSVTLVDLDHDQIGWKSGKL